METQPESSFSLELSEKHIARAWIAACISAGVTVILGLFALAGNEVIAGFDAWILLDAAILAGLAFGVARRSRVCAVILVIYGISNVVDAALEGRSFPILGFVFIYFYVRGAIGIFRYHRHRHQTPQLTNI
jgi:hypothetical protein